MAGEGKKHDPLKQFEIKEIFQIEAFGYDISFTNSSLMLVLSMVIITAVFAIGTSSLKIVPGRFQMILEIAYGFIAKMMSDNIGDKGKKYFPLVFSLFSFILVVNLLGILPYSFTATSHLAVTGALALIAFITVTIVGFARHGFGYFKLFLPEGVPNIMLPLIFVIELISYFIRPISLAVRLAMAMTMGHILMKVGAILVVTFGFMAGWVPFIFLTGLIGIEIFVAFLQAYIFSILVCIYLNDAINMH